MMEEKLQAVFTNVNDWLKFAEAKNAALLAANAATIFGALQLLLGDKKLTFWSELFLQEFVLCSAIGAFISLLSFLPVLKITEGARQSPRVGENLLFYGDIARHTPESYLRKMRESYGISDSELPIEPHIAQQIVVNSRIGLRKFRHFQIAAWFTLAGLATPLLALILWFVSRPKEVETAVVVPPVGT